MIVGAPVQGVSASSFPVLSPAISASFSAGEGLGKRPSRSLSSMELAVD